MIINVNLWSKHSLSVSWKKSNIKLPLRPNYGVECNVSISIKRVPSASSQAISASPAKNNKLKTCTEISVRDVGVSFIIVFVSPRCWIKAIHRYLDILIYRHLHCCHFACNWTCFILLHESLAVAENLLPKFHANPWCEQFVNLDCNSHCGSVNEA